MKKVVLSFAVLFLSTWFTNQALGQDLITRVSAFETSLVRNNVVPGYSYIDKVEVKFLGGQSTPLVPQNKAYDVRVYRNENLSCTSGGVLIGSYSFSTFSRLIRASFTIDVLDQLESCPNSNDPCPVVPFNIFVELVPLTQPGGPIHMVSGVNTNCFPIVPTTATEGITSPAEGANIFTGDTFNLTWNPSFFGNVSTVQIQVFSNGTLRFSGNVPNNGIYNSYQGPDGAIEIIITGGGQTDTVSFDFTRD
ncbi:hypothetical protein BKI52_15510 [marine bacterium AO1-C]|nr:hypothetical protein BKI52_15510 [marine bacterium AO1-C]